MKLHNQVSIFPRHMEEFYLQSESKIPTYRRNLNREVQREIGKLIIAPMKFIEPLNPAIFKTP